jgi:hypothetical protein
VHIITNSRHRRNNVSFLLVLTPLIYCLDGFRSLRFYEAIGVRHPPPGALTRIFLQGLNNASRTDETRDDYHATLKELERLGGIGLSDF